uniref:Rhodanese domain-containing protein n=1 Tax=Plectus sambesii TaxID=2011161 RepID=A0A914XA75_9BILA
MSQKRLVDCQWLADQVTKGAVNQEGLRVLDCTFKPGPKPDPTEFKSTYYGQWEKLMEKPSEHTIDFSISHIPGAVHANIDVAMYPGDTERFALYPPQLFEEYIQRLGVNQGDHIVLYDRGMNGGMMFAAKFWWLFKTYGHDNVSILNGGFHAWQKGNNPVNSEVVQLSKGDWKANLRSGLNVTFEELTTKQEDGRDLIDKADEVNFLDARKKEQFHGEEETGLNPKMVNGSHIPGFINIPANQLVDSNGLLKSPADIKAFASSKGFREGKPIITCCNLGIQASLLTFALSLVDEQYPLRLYNGSLKEMEIRAPQRISAKE